MFMMKVKSKYLAMSGNTNDVGGKIFETSSRKTTSERRMLLTKYKIKMLNFFGNFYLFGNRVLKR